MKQRLICAARAAWADRALWLCATGLVLLFYNLYLNTHFSPDTWSTAQYFREIDAAGYTLTTKYNLLYVPFAMQGRFVRGFLMLLLGAFNQSALMVSRFANAVALGLFVCALVCGAKTLRAALCGASADDRLGLGKMCAPCALDNGTATQKASETHTSSFTRVDSALCFLGTAVLLCNPFFCDWLQFAECALVYPLGLLCSVLAARALVTRWHPMVRVAVSAGCAVLAAGIYQITLQIFVLFAMTALVLRTVRGTQACNGKRMAARAFVLAAQALLVYGFAVIPQYLFTRVFYHNERMSTNLAATLELIQIAQRDLWSMKYLGEPTPLFAACVLALFVLGLGALVWAICTRRISPMALGVIGAAGAAFYASVFVMMLVSDGSIPHRTVVGFFGIPLFLTVCLAAVSGATCTSAQAPAQPRDHAASQTNATVALPVLLTATKVAAIAVVWVLLAFGWVHTQRLGTQLLRSNAQDMAIARSIHESIVQYEAASGSPVAHVYFYRMPGYHINYPDVFQSHDLNMRGWIPEWSRLPLLNTVNGTQYTKGEPSDLVYAEHFAGREWDAFESSQVHCTGDTAYVAIY